MNYTSCLAAFLTYCVGLVMRIPLPVFLRPMILGAFARFFGINLTEAQLPLVAYPTMDAFFTRQLRESCRDIAPDAIVCPVDGVLLATGAIEEGQLFQAKGLRYSVAALLQSDKVSYEGGCFATFYLAPSDCHRIFSPLAGTLTGVRWVPGALFPVREPYISQCEGLYARNERVILDYDTEFGKMALVLVGAFNVGHMTIPFLTPSSPYRFRSCCRETTSQLISEPIEKGQWVGTFHLGSTVVVLFDSGVLDMGLLHLGRHYHYGQRLGLGSVAG